MCMDLPLGQELPSRVKLTAWRVLAMTAVRTGLTDIMQLPGNAVLMYHSVGEPYGNPCGTVSPARLQNDLSYVRDRFQIVDLPDVLESGDEPRIAVTFDDGYRNFYTDVLPVLEALEVPATLFVISEFVGEDRQNPRSSGLAAGPDEMLTESQMCELAEHDLVTLGNHTATHPSLPELGADELEAEIVGAQKSLEERYGIDITRFCYPGGKYDSRSRNRVSETHRLGVGVSRGFLEPPVDPVRKATIPRINGARSPSVVRWEVSGLGEAVRQRYRQIAHG